MTVDPRFYAPQGALTLGKIAELTGAVLNGDASVEITSVSAAATGRRGDLAFLDGDGKGDVSVGADVSALILNEANLKHAPEGVPCLVTPLPRHFHGLVAYALFQPRHLIWSGDDRISPEAKVHPGAIVSPGAVVGPGATVGEGTVIGANAVVGPGVQVGRNCRIGANVSLICRTMSPSAPIPALIAACLTTRSSASVPRSIISARLPTMLSSDAALSWRLSGAFPVL